ncbi:MAG: hypothetical protein ACHBN1_29420 [Heteroscytonema crispum UTEX LB 1556]
MKNLKYLGFGGHCPTPDALSRGTLSPVTWVGKPDRSAPSPTHWLPYVYFKNRSEESYIL